MRKYALDCEMVGSGNRSILARVSIINEFGDVVLDSYVKPTAPVTDYRTFFSGVTERHLRNGEDYEVIRYKVSRIINNCILIGHSLHFDLDVLGLHHPTHLQRDLAKYWRLQLRGQPVSLKKLAKQLLDRDIQNFGGHDSIEDAKASMDIYHDIINQINHMNHDYAEFCPEKWYPKTPEPSEAKSSCSKFVLYLVLVSCITIYLYKSV